MIKSRFKLKSNTKGITLVALVITIVILIILATVAINFAFGESGLITKANLAKEQTDIAGEKEKIALAVLDARGRNNGKLDKAKLQEALDSNVGEGKTVVTYDSEESVYYVKFVDNQRIYKVTEDGQVEYLLKEEDIMSQATLKVSLESSTTPQLYYQVEAESTIPMKVDKYMLVYAWSNSKDNMPEDEEFIDSGAIGTGRTLKANISSTDTEEGEYYLWIRMIVGEQEKTQCFGPYKIKDHTTLVATTNEKESTSGFLGNENIQRGLIKSINIVTTLEGHSLGEANTWDVTQGQNGKYIGWYEENENGNYEVTIGGEGGIVANSDSSNLFRYIGYGIENEEVVIEGLENLDTGLVTTMSAMFDNSKVKQLDLNSFDTSNVNSMERMFYNCKNLAKLDINNFDTTNVKSMTYMFSSCTTLQELNISSFNTIRVNSMLHMFSNCINLNKLDVSNFNTSNVTVMDSMFNMCSSLEELDVSNFDTTNVYNMAYMFAGCTNLNLLDISNFNTKKVNIMQSLFSGCSSLIKIEINNLDTNNVTSMAYFFSNCSNLESIDVSNFNTSNVNSFENMFYNCNSLTQLDVSNFDTKNIVNMKKMFWNCKNLTELNVKNFDTSKVTNMEEMFNGCKNLEKLDISNFNTENIKSTNYMFFNCVRLTQLDISNFNMNNVEVWESMFSEVPTTVEIITNEETKAWLKEKFPEYTNVKTEDEIEREEEV